MKSGQPPSVDVVIPVRNGARFIAICLDSVRVQTLQPNAVIVVDDGSTDGTSEILADCANQWPKLRVIRSEPRGVSHARNRGIAACRSPFIAFLDSDDVWLPEKLERQMTLFTPDRPEVGFVHCACFQIDEFGQDLPNTSVFSPSKRGDVFGLMIRQFYHIAGSASAVVARHDLVVAVDGFDETLSQAEDQDLWLKLAKYSEVDYVDDAMVALRSHKDNSYESALRNNPELILLQKLKIWNKWFEYVKDHEAVLEYFRRAIFFVGVKSKSKLNPNVGLYFRLKRTKLPLARRLFPSLHSYLKYHCNMRRLN